MKHHETGHGRSLYKAAITAWGWESNLVWVCNIWAIQKTCQQAERYATTCPQESFAVFVASLLPGLCLAKAPEWLSSTSNGTSRNPTPQMTAGSKIICWANCQANVELTWGNWFWDVWAAWEAARSQRILLWPSLAETTSHHACLETNQVVQGYMPTETLLCCKQILVLCLQDAPAATKQAMVQWKISGRIILGSGLCQLLKSDFRYMERSWKIIPEKQV